MNTLKNLIYMVFLFVLFSCGGEDIGFDEEGDMPEAETQSPLAITEENSTDVVSKVYKASNLSQDHTSEITHILSEQEFLQASDEPCDTGSLTIEANLGAEETVSAGDVLEIEADGCLIGDTLTEGSVRVEVLGFEQSDFELGFSLALEFDDYSISNGDVHSVVDGEVSVSTFIVENVVEAELRSERLRLVVDEHATILEDFHLTLRTELGGETGGETDFEMSGTIHDSQLEGAVSFETLFAFTSSISEEEPSVGVLEITGAEESSIIVSAGESEGAILDIDSDGDGESDESIEVSWEELDFEGFEH